MTENATLPQWDLTNVYPSLDSAEFKQANQDFAAMIDKLEGYLKDNNIHPDTPPTDKDPAKLAEIINPLIEQTNETYKLGFTIRAFAWSFVTTDSRNDAAAKAMSEWQQTFVKLSQLGTLVEGWIGTFRDAIPEIVKQAGAVSEHGLWLEETGRASQYLMSAAEENLAAELDLSGGSAWGKLQGVITSQLAWEIETEDGETKKMPMTAIINLRSHASETMRRRGYQAELDAWKSVENQLAACMNGVKGSVYTLDKRRGREDALQSSLETNRIDRETLEAMLSAMEDSFPMFRKYFKSKAKKLGKDKLPWWDLFAPMGDTDRNFTYEEAGEFVISNFAGFSEDLAEFTDHAIKHNWIDVGPREGKRAGAFCMGIAGPEESRILLNFDGSLDSVSTLAHELGHGFHNYSMKGKTVIQKSIPMTVAETASIMCETIITEAAIANAKTPGEELAILETDLNGASQVVVDIYSRYLFEKEVFERRAKSELSATELNEIMEQAQEQTYGEGLDPDYRQPYMWTWKPHYYRASLSFYNYPYTFGLLFATGLYAIYRERGQDFVPDYQKLLAETGMGMAADLAARFEIDIRTPDFWQGSLDIIGQRVERYVALDG